MSINIQHTILRRPEVLAELKICKSSLQNQINSGLFPKAISLGGRSVGFISTEVDAILNAWIEEKTPEEIKQLVIELTTQRKLAA